MSDSLQPFRWISASFVTGKVYGEVPGFTVTTTETRMTEYTTAEGTLAWDRIPINWVDMVTPYGAMMILVDEDSDPIWGGIVTGTSRDTAGDGITVSMATCDAYLDRCFISDTTYSQTSQTAIAADLVQKFCITGRRNCFRIQAAESTTLRDHTYLDSDGNSVYVLLQNLSTILGGIEWCVEMRRDGDLYYPLLIIADSLGESASVDTMFDLSMMKKFTVKNDWTSNKGANRVRAVSTADGESSAVPMSAWLTYDDPTRAVVDYSYTPSSGITVIQTLTNYAQATLNTLRLGTTTVSFDLNMLNCPIPGRDWHLGDLIGWDCTDAIERFPDAYKGTARVVGWKLDFNDWKLTPITTVSGD